MPRNTTTLLRTLLAATAALALWSALVLHGTLEGWGRPMMLAPPADDAAFASAARSRIDAGHSGNAVFRLLTAGRVTAEHNRSASAPVDADTLFPVASLGKWVTAVGVLTLVEAGKLDLDAPVGTYLTRWTLPADGHDPRQVTVRRLLSHTAGLTDGLGYAGFAPGTPVQALEASLTQAADASPGADGRVRVGEPPGDAWRYSGGGYTLLQLLVEEVTGEPFAAYMRRAVFLPLGMTRTTFDVGEAKPNLAAIHDRAGRATPHLRYTALAATGLYTTAADMTRFLQAHLPGPRGEPAGRGVLQPATLQLMHTPHANRMGADIWGLGTLLYVPTGRGGFIVGHDGSNEPAINAAVRLDPQTGNGIIVLETGDPLLATAIAGDWTLWQAGAIDALAFTQALPTMLAVLVAGWLAIIAAAILLHRLALGRRARGTRGKSIGGAAG